MFKSIHAALERDVQRRYFDEGPGGERLWVPWGAGNPLARRSCIVRDDATHEAIVAALVRSDLRAYVFAAVFVVGVFSLVGWPWDSHESMLLALKIHLVVAAGILCAILVMPVFLQRRFSSLPPGPVRRIGSAVAVHEREMRRPWTAWVWAALMGLLGFLFLRASYQLLQAGKVPSAGIAGAVGLAAVLAAALGPAVLRLRRLRFENVRLEMLVSERTAELRELNRTLEDRVREQVSHIERLGQLKHFFAAPVAEMILNEKGFDPAKVHRRELTAVSMDLRGFTAFSETSEPEEVISVLRTYHAELGIHVNRCHATLEHFAGDGVMVFLNDPVQIDDHPMRALELAVALRDAMRPHLEEWRSHGFDLGMGVGIATGYATIGAVGYEGRWEYAAIGTVCNLAARLCAEAKDGQIVVSKRFLSRLGDRAVVEPLGERTLKGLSRPVAAFNVLGIKARHPVAA